MGKLIVKCAGCGIDIEIKHKERYHPDIPYYCHTCIPEKYHLACTKCGKVFGSRNPSTKLCPTCYAAQFHTISCVMCGEPFTCRCDSGRTLCRHCTLRENGRKNIIKYNKSDIGRAKSAEVGKRTIKYCHEAAKKINGIRHCDVCGKDAMYVVGFGCMNCHNNSDVMRKTTRDRNLRNWQNEDYRHRIAQNLHEYLKKPNFITKDHVRYYKGIPVDDLSKRLLSGEEDINNYPGFNIRFGRVCYHHKDILTDGTISSHNSNFYELDNVKYVYDWSQNDYVEWDEFKSRLYDSTLDKLQFYQEVKQRFPDAFIQRTYREERNTRAGQYMMEQDLVDKGITYLVFVKFYINNDTKEIKPLVVGESASKLVNTYGTDIGFSLDDQDQSCTGRYFINSNDDLDWFRDEVLIIPFHSKDSAFSHEQLLIQNYVLCQS